LTIKKSQYKLALNRSKTQKQEKSKMTYLYQKLSASKFATALRDDENAGWTDEQAWALASYYEELAQDLGEPVALDVVAVRSEWTAYPSATEALADHCHSGVPENEQEALDFLSEYTVALRCNGGSVVVLNY